MGLHFLSLSQYYVSILFSRARPKFSSNPCHGSRDSSRSSLSTLRPEPIKPRTTPFAKPEGRSQIAEKALTRAEIDATARIIEHFQKEDLIDDEKFWLTKECVLRYYHASKTDITQAISRISKTLAWRKEVGIYSITAEEICTKAQTGKQVLLGFDYARRPVLYLYPGRENTSFSPRQSKYFVWSLERCIELMPLGVDTLVICINYKSTTSITSSSFTQSREVIHILQNHYVERLGKGIIINMPWFVTAFFKLICPFLDPKIRQSLIFNENLRNHIPSHQLDSEFDGGLHFDYVHTEYWPCLLNITQLRSDGMRRRWREYGACVGISEWDLKDGLEEEVDLKLENEVHDIFLFEQATKDSEQTERPGTKYQDSIHQEAVETAIPTIVNKGHVCVVTEETENRDSKVLQSAMSDTASFVTAAEKH
ncbi:CRAL-TRIO domain-containing protein [Neolecta irregularis DAH-3]|uniref:CRAL-TRIO domain-containing protein n=1 Tax=Neolecta irregularis (strain DAH-3) TaxID=1198029 RepID=A0A1U7LK39_NEOID|nr:CRAL-TRIO domain-containing protein [Neolecta irregularis DAH-3]|eukprot:OLL23025.1 CRAL-TRIO domain-containing protein [Neolecta irregularis DAH-3]